MKIGLIASAYNCGDFLDDCLKPWASFKQEGNYELHCSIIHNCFYENKDLGLPLKSPDDTEQILEKYYYLVLVVFQLDKLVNLIIRDLNVLKH